MKEVVIKNKRITWVDFCKGVTIILTIIGHSMIDERIMTLIYSFHMALFVILSGYTIKIPNNKDMLFVRVKKDFILLIIPFFVCLFLDSLFMIFFNTQTIDYAINYFIHNIFYYQLDSNANCYTIWFLPALFFSKFIYYFLRLVFKKPLPLILFITLFGIFFIKLPFYISKGMAMLVFLHIGYVIKNKIDFEDTKTTILIPSISLFVYLLMIFTKNIGQCSFNDNSYSPNCLFSFINAIAASFFAILMCVSVDEVNIPFIKVFRVIGRNTLVILIVHHLDKYIYKFPRGSTNDFLIDLIRILTVLAVSAIVILVKQFIYKIKKSNLEAH